MGKVRKNWEKLGKIGKNEKNLGKYGKIGKNWKKWEKWEKIGKIGKNGKKLEKLEKIEKNIFPFFPWFTSKKSRRPLGFERLCDPFAIYPFSTPAFNSNQVISFIMHICNMCVKDLIDEKKKISLRNPFE